MLEKIPYHKILRLALITSPLFGIFGATPVFVFDNSSWQRFITGFTAVTGITIIFWALNVLLLRLVHLGNFKSKDIVRFLGSVVVCTGLLYSFSDTITDHMISQLPERLGQDFPPAFSQNLKPPRKAVIMPLIQSQSINVIIMVLLEMTLLREKKIAVEIENTQLRMVNLEARHNQLKQQLHPHFLFNSLSTLRSLIKRSPSDAEEYLDKLSDLLRSSTSNDPQTLVSLAEEIELCNTYLEMQRVRFGDALNYRVDVPSELQKTGRIPVYSIQLLVENAIKHNVLTVRQPLFVLVTSDGAKRTVSVTNNLQAKKPVEESGGVGLSNLAERYRLLGNDEITIQKTDKEFSVTIKVIEDEGSYH